MRRKFNMNKRIILFTSAIWMFFLTGEISSARIYNANTGRFQTMDAFEGDQSAPQSLHKYIYAWDDPVNNIDPSGNASTSLNAAALGRAVHKIIGDDFINERRPYGISGRSIAKILKLPNKIQTLLPDLVDTQKKAVFEIKPMTVAGTAAAAVQLG
jgi:hypothetical protein